MKVELFSQPKYRAGNRAGDDVSLFIPGAVAAVFDGATDPKGTVVAGAGAGRYAAQTLATSAAALFATPDNRHLPLPDLMTRLAKDLARATTPLGLEIKPSTTVALALDLGDAWRFITLGDTGIRLNGDRVLVYHKLVDEVSARARIALFHLFASRIPDKTQLELTTRRAIFLGLDQAAAEGLITMQEAEAVIGQTLLTPMLKDIGDPIVTFLKGGIQTQHRHGNTTGHVFSFDTMDGTTPTLVQTLDETHTKSDIHSIEIFSDGYQSIPDAPTAAAWEAAFHQAETIDFHNIGPHATVKGATRAEHFDDRTLISLTT